MSGEGPESIPTSADRRSKRPVKKRALTPVSAQAATVEALFAKPDQEIRVPPPAGTALVRQRAAPPEIVSNVQGSSSGAGSGEFHVYKASRRREYARLRQLDEEARLDREATEFAEAKREREARDDEKTKRNREKREKAKARKAKVKKSGRVGREGGDGTSSAKMAAPSQDSIAEIEQDDEEPNGNGATMDGHKVTAPKLSTANGGNRTAAAKPDPEPISVADGPGLLIQDDDD